MAGGGLMQLVAYGAQDLYLTHEPQITFFKVVYRRHTNFAVESIEQTISGTVGAGQDVDVQISRNGDLVNNILLELTVQADSDTDTSGSTQTPEVGAGFSCINEVQIQIGGQEIDKQYGHWMMAWHELTASYSKRVLGHVMWDKVGRTSQKLYVPLMFWFCRDNGLALPLIALQYHPVNLKIKFAAANNTGMGGLTLTSAKCFVDYVFLDTDERKKFAQTKHEYLIEQVQKFTQQLNRTAGETTKADLIFNHPVKELVWFVPPKYTTTTDAGTGQKNFNAYNAFLESGQATLRLNNTLRFKERSGRYFDSVQTYQHHTGSGRQGLYCYSFALNPEKHQPSGSCNFSRIDSAILEMTNGSASDVSLSSSLSSVHVYAHNYNVLRIMSGMGGLAYSN